MRAILLSWLMLMHILVCVRGGSRVRDGAPTSGPGPLVLQVRADRGSYLPGEPVNLRFRVINNTQKSIPLDPGSTVWTGRLGVFVAAGDGEYLQYDGPQWGLKCGVYLKPIILGREKPSFETEASVLWNLRPETTHLNERAAARHTRGRLSSSFALPRPGAYRIKAVLAVDGPGQRIESEPARLEVEEPAAVDLLIWNTIKDNGEYAHFLQTGHPSKSVESEEARRIVSQLEHLLAAYPDSRYAAHIRASLDKHREHTRKLKAAREGHH